MRSPHIAVVALVTVGCAPTLSTFQPAHVAPRGHAQAGFGYEVSVPTGALFDAADRAKALVDRAQMMGAASLSPEEKWSIFDAGANLVINPPAFALHLGIAYTVIDRVEANFRYSGSSYRLGGRYQILSHEDGPFDMVVGLGISRFSYTIPFSDKIPLLKVDDFSRWQVDLPLLIGTSRQWFRTWVGPKVLFTSFGTQARLELPDEVTLATFDGQAFYVGGQGGIAFGYRWLFLALELTLAESFTTVHFTAPTLPAHDADLSTFIVYPSFGLMGEF